MKIVLQLNAGNCGKEGKGIEIEDRMGVGFFSGNALF
jgi:hypothetical protein